MNIVLIFRVARKLATQTEKSDVSIIGRYKVDHNILKTEGSAGMWLHTDKCFVCQ